MTEWHRYVEYRCRHCGERCINPRDAECSRRGHCRDCKHVPRVPNLRETAPSPEVSDV